MKDTSSTEHSLSLLKELSNCDIKNSWMLIQKIMSIWAWHNAITLRWRSEYSIAKRSKNPILYVELHTGGFSANEDVIEALQDNMMFWLMWWWKTERGGHYYFKIDFSKIGYKPVASFIKEHQLTRQYIHRHQSHYDWIVISKKKRLLRPAIGSQTMGA